MVMESRSEHVNNLAQLWRQEHHPILVTIKGGIEYYEDPQNAYGPFYAVKGDQLWLTTFYGLEDVELFG